MYPFTGRVYRVGEAKDGENIPILLSDAEEAQFFNLDVGTTEPNPIPDWIVWRLKKVLADKVYPDLNDQYASGRLIVTTDLTEAQALEQWTAMGLSEVTTTFEVEAAIAEYGTTMPQVVADATDDKVAALAAQVERLTALLTAKVEVAPVDDPRDDEIAELRAQLAALRGSIEPPAPTPTIEAVDPVPEKVPTVVNL